MEIQRFGQRMVELLPQLIRGMLRQESNHLSKGKITLPQLTALEYFMRNEGSPMNNLADFLKISRPAVTGLVDRLVGQHLLRREGDPQDRRIIRIHTTPKGRQIVSHIWGQKRRTLTRIFSQISPKNRAQYLVIVEQVVAILAKEENR